MSNNNANIQAIFVGYEAGRARGAQMVRGAKFIGSMPEAVAAGFAKGSLGYEGFQIGFFETIPTQIVTDLDGVIA